jgi:Flp pilus assembly protein TadD
LRIRTHTQLLALLLAVGSPLAGCARDEASRATAARRTEAGVQARSQALIDEGNAFYRAQDYANAATRYAAAAVVKQDEPAAYFGLGMAFSKLRRFEDARAAYAHAHDLIDQARDSAARAANP